MIVMLVTQFKKWRNAHWYSEKSFTQIFDNMILLQHYLTATWFVGKGPNLSAVNNFR